MSTNKRDETYYNMCPYCKECKTEEVEEIEDEDHILQCLSAKRKQLRDEWLKETKEFLSQSHTPENVKDAIYLGLESWLDKSCVNIENDYGNATAANNQQQAIGWRHFIRGRIAIEWGECVKDHLRDQQIKGISYEKWGSRLMSINWKHILIIWKERNGKEHGVTLQEQDVITKTKLIEEIEKIYNENQYIIQQSVVAFELKNLYEMNTAQLTTYLYGIKIIVKMYTIKAKKAKKNSIENYFNARTAKVTEERVVSIKDKSELDPGEIVLQ